MALDQTANFVRQGVSSSVGSGDTSISVSDATEFPDPSSGEYNCVLWDAAVGRPDEDPNAEIVRVTGRDTGTDTLTVSRGAESTSAASHPSSSALALAPTAKMFSDIQTKTSGLSDDGTSLAIDELNNATFVDAADGASAVQTAVDNNSLVYVYSSSDPVEWSNSVRVPNDTECKAWGDYLIQIPDSNSLDTPTARDGTFKTVIANKDFSGSATGVVIEGFHIDFQGDPSNGSTKTQDQNAAAVWIHNASESEIRDCEVENVLPDADFNSGYRVYCVLLSDSTDCKVVDCIGDGAGYEAIGFRGANDSCDMIRCEGYNGAVHSMQVAFFSGNGVTAGGQPNDITVRDCRGDTELTLHGFESGDPAYDLVVERCRDMGIEIVGKLENVVIDGCYGDYVEIHGVPDTGGTVVDGITIRGIEANIDPSVVRIWDFSGNTVDVDNITIENIHQNADEQVVKLNGGSVSVANLWVRNCSNNSGGVWGILSMFSGATLTNCHLDGVMTDSTNAVRVSGTGTTLSVLRFLNSDLSSTTPTSTANGGTIETELIDMKGEAALGGSAPDATNWINGAVVEDTDNAGDLYYIYDDSASGGASQIAT